MPTIKSKLKQEILDKISIMENNTFLFPKSWSDKIDMIDEEWSYKTYNNGEVGDNRYHNLEIHVEDDTILNVGFRGNRIQVIQDLDKKQTSIKDVLFYVTKIYEELHSFKNHDEGKRDIRKKITQAKQRKKQADEDIKELKQQLIDLKTLE